MNGIKVLGIDLGKDVCSVVGLDGAGNVLLRRRMRRDSIMKLTVRMPACVMAMEACCGAHHLGRQFREQGHEVRLMSPEYVRPYVKANKNGLAREKWRAPTEEPGGVLWETGTGRRRSSGVKRCGWH